MPAPEKWRATGGRALGLVAVCYLLLSVGVEWHAWTGGPASTASCGCGDPALTLWFLAWPAHAIAHGQDPLYSTALFHPTGVNLLSNTGTLALGIPLAPVTWLWGPVASLTVAATLAPAASALAAYALAARWARWAPAAFVGGLLYGFSPFLLDNVAGGHLNLATLCLLPLIVLQLDELVVRQRARPLRSGAVLGLLVVVQFFVSTEMLLVTLVASAVGLAVLLVAGLVGDRAATARRVGRAVPGLALAGGVAVVLLAYPLWFALRGPGALTGRIWPTVASFDTYTPRDLVVPFPGTGWDNVLKLWGYFGPAPPAEIYLGAGALAVAVVGLVVWWRDLRLWFFAAMAVVTAALALGTVKEPWAPWRILQGLPLLDDVIQSRFIVVTQLCLAVAVAIVVHRARSALPGRVGWGSVLSAAVAAVAVVPVLAFTVPALPLTTMTVQVPQWLATASRRTTADHVLLVYPPPFSGVQSAMAWQAVAGMPYQQVGGGGPQGLPTRAGPERPGELVLDRLSLAIGPEPTGTRVELRSVRAALTHWGVDTVVVPRQLGPPLVGQGRDAGYAAGFVTAALGRPPTIEADSWVWADVGRSPPPLTLDPGTLLRCWAANRHAPVPSPNIPECVMTLGNR